MKPLSKAYILNLAITSTIDTSRGYYQNGEVKSEFKIIMTTDRIQIT